MLSWASDLRFRSGFLWTVQDFGLFIRSALGGSWYLLTNYNCTYNPLISPISVLIWL